MVRITKQQFLTTEYRENPLNKGQTINYLIHETSFYLWNIKLFTFRREGDEFAINFNRD